MEIIKFLQAFSNPGLDVFFNLVTMMGEQGFIIVFIAIIFWCINKKAGYKLGFTLLSGTIINSSLKAVFHTKRPIGSEGIHSQRIKTASGYSFPSGHTQSTASLWTTISIQYKKTKIYILSTILILLVGISRLYLGVHWPIDVFAGATIGIIWATLCCLLFDYSIKKNNKFLLLIVILPEFLGVIVFNGGSSNAKIIALLLGFIVGYFIEDKYINFNEKTELPKQIAKFILGITVTIIIELGLKLVLPSSIIFDFTRYFVIGLWLTAGLLIYLKNFLLKEKLAP